MILNSMEKTNQYGLILTRKGISKTKFRIDLLRLFYNSKKSLVVEDIISFFGDMINKVTVYRALDDFEKHGLIHIVPDKKNLKRFSLCNLDDCSQDSHIHNHSHFICDICNTTFCIDDIIPPKISNIQGYYIKQSSFILEGYCKECNSTH